MYFGVWVPNGLKNGGAALIETFARFQAGFLSSEDFHRNSWISNDFIDFHGFSKISMDFHSMYFRALGVSTVRLNLLPL